MWHHFAVTWDYDGSGYDGSYAIYVDGADVTDIGGSSYEANLSDNSNDSWKIGRRGTNSSGNIFFDGELDELTFYLGRSLESSLVYETYLRKARWYRDTPTSAIELVQFGVKGPNDSDYNWDTAELCGDSSVAYCPIFQSSDSGQYDVIFRIVDSVGNETTSDVYHFYMDDTGPSITGDGSGLLDLNSSVTQISEKTWEVALSGTISDPDLDTGISGSSVNTSTLYITLQNSALDVVGSPNQQATVNSDGTWTIGYEISSIPPAGIYLVTASAEDDVENRSEGIILGLLNIDAQGPDVKMAHRLWSTQLISDTNSISGVVTDQPDWAGPVLALHFEEGDGANAYYNYGDEQQLLTCTGNCPDNTSAGAFGRGLDFADGTQSWALDNTVISDSINFDRNDDFTVAFWVQPAATQQNTAQETNSLIEKWGNGSSYPYSISIYNSSSSNAGKIVASRSDGTNTVVLTSTAVLTTDFSHIALVKEDDRLTLYVDGTAQMSVTDTTTGDTTNSDSLALGHRPDDPSYTFMGVLDELYIYDRALSSADIYAMAQDEVDGNNQVELAFEVIDFASYPDLLSINDRQNEVSWQSAGVDLPTDLGSAWSYTMSDMENWYYIHLRGQDSDGNAADAETVWHGLIDHVAPIITASGVQSGAGESGETVYTFTMSDFLLDVDTAVYPCDSPQITTQTYSDSNLPYDGFAYEISGTCTVDELQTSGTFSICDVADHCVTEIVTPTVTDDMQYALAAETTSVAELNLGSTTTLTYTITRSGDLDRSSSVGFDFLASSATLLTDFDNLQVSGAGINETNSTITFTAGANIATITLDVLGDNIDEADEEIVLTLSSPTGAAGTGVGTLVNSPVTTTIVDDDTPQVKITPSTLVIAETGTTSADFVMTLSGEPTAPVTVTLTTDDNTECIVSPNELTVTSLTWQTGATATVTSVDETSDDGDQICTVITSAADSQDTDYDGLVVPDVSVTVIDDDGAPSINFATATVTTTEETENLLVSLTLSNPSASTVQVTVMSGDDSATAGEDYTAVSETVTFAPSETSTTVAIPILEDLLDEPTESFTLTLSSPVAASIGLVDETTVEIEDDDAPARISIADSSAPETDLSGSMVFTVTLDTPSAFTITVDYVTQDETAIAGEYYTAR